MTKRDKTGNSNSALARWICFSYTHILNMFVVLMNISRSREVGVRGMNLMEKHIWCIKLKARKSELIVRWTKNKSFMEYLLIVITKASLYLFEEVIPIFSSRKIHSEYISIKKKIKINQILLFWKRHQLYFMHARRCFFFFSLFKNTTRTRVRQYMFCPTKAYRYADRIKTSDSHLFPRLARH